MPFSGLEIQCRSALLARSLKAWRFQIGVVLIVAHSIGAAMGNPLGVCSAGTAATLSVVILDALWWYANVFTL